MVEIMLKRRAESHIVNQMQKKQYWKFINEVNEFLEKSDFNPLEISTLAVLVLCFLLMLYA